MNPIDAAIAALESQDPEEQLSYRAAAKKLGVAASTLTRRHHKQTQSCNAAAEQRRLLTPQQEAELIKYTSDLSSRGLTPTRSMVKTYVSGVAQWEPSASWLTRFFRRNREEITLRRTLGIDRDRHQADSYTNYRSWFDLLYAKLNQYDVAPHNIYNMDEKGFLLGVTQRRKRASSRQLWDDKKVTAAIQDGSREWITILGCVCADGSSVDPCIIFEGKAGLRDEWVSRLDDGKHQFFFTSSPSGWTNDKLGLAWLEQVFDRRTKEKARRDWRLLLVDGHGSHVTPAFIEYCDTHRILLAVFPPHASHSLQPLDVAVYSPLSAAYSTQLNDYIQRSQGLINMQKSDFLPLFWAAYTSAVTPQLILTSFAASGIHPREPDAVLKRFKTTTPERGSDIETRELGDNSTWRQLRKNYDAAVPNKSSAAAKQVGQALHSLQIRNELLHTENAELRAELTTKKRRKPNSKLLELTQRREYQSAAVIWSPRAVREARAFELQKQHQEEAEKIQKQEAREIKAATAEYQRKINIEAKRARAIAREARKKEREAKGAELAAARAKKAQQRAAATSKKSRDTQNTPKRKASQSQKSKTIKRRRVVGAGSGGAAAPPPAQPPTRTTTRGRNVKLPAKYQ